MNTTTCDLELSRELRPIPGAALRQSTSEKARLDDLRCLVVSLNADRNRELSWAASSAGWTVVAAADAGSAVRCMQRWSVQLAVVDLTGAPPTTLQELREVVETLARRSGSLLVVSGRLNDVHEERWARQLGVWMYLPDADCGGLETICGEARQVTEKLNLVKLRRLTAPVECSAGNWPAARKGRPMEKVRRRIGPAS